MSNFVYTDALARLSSGEFVWDASDLWVLLLDAAGGYVPIRGHGVVADLNPATTELTATNYERKALDGLAVFAMSDRVRWSASAASWGLLGVGDDPMAEVQAAVIYEHHDDGDADSKLVCYIDSIAGELTGDNALLAFAGGGVIDVVAP